MLYYRDFKYCIYLNFHYLSLIFSFFCWDIWQSKNGLICCVNKYWPGFRETIHLNFYTDVPFHLCETMLFSHISAARSLMCQREIERTLLRHHEAAHKYSMKIVSILIWCPSVYFWFFKFMRPLRVDCLMDESRQILCVHPFYKTIIDSSELCLSFLNFCFSRWCQIVTIVYRRSDISCAERGTILPFPHSQHLPLVY